MTPEQIHDALNLLPSDLITEADKLRTPKKKPLAFRSWVATAACAAIVLMLGSFTIANFLPSMQKSAESIAEAPTAAAPMAPAEMQQESFAMDTITLTPTGEPEEAPAAEAPDGDHRHGFAEFDDTKNSDMISGAYCGNTITTIHIGGESFDIAGSDSIAITDILANLNYDPNKVCRCMAAFTVDIEFMENIQVHLGEAFARCEKGQADLTEEQAQTIQDIIDGLEIVVAESPVEASVDLTGIQYIATPVLPTINTVGDPRTSLVTSAGALYDYYVKYCEVFYMDDYFAATVPYNRAWFLTNDLLILRIGAPHPEFHYDVTAFALKPDTDPAAWQITLERNPDEPTDIAFDNNSMWHILIPVPKGMLTEETVILIDFS